VGNSASVGVDLARVFLFLGDNACSVDRSSKHELVRMLVNPLVWIVVGMLIAAFVI